MKAARIHQFGSPDVIIIDDMPCPTPGPGEVIVRVVAAGVGLWNALIRTGKAVVNSPLPLVLGAELSGAVTIAGPSVPEFKTGDEVYGATNKQFYGAYAEYALASTTTLAPKPGLRNVEAASVPVVGVTAWQMLFDYGQVQSGQTILIHGAAGNVGAYAVQLASRGFIFLRPLLPVTGSMSQASGPPVSSIIDKKGSRTSSPRWMSSSTRPEETPANAPTVC